MCINCYFRPQITQKVLEMIQKSIKKIGWEGKNLAKKTRFIEVRSK